MQTDEERFWSKVDKSGGPDACWPWMLSRQRLGYGQFYTSRTDSGPRLFVLAHRFAYKSAIGPIPDGLECLHSCDNPPCCNPAHLWLGTQAANVLDMCDKGRHATVRCSGERNGTAKLTNDSVREIRRLYSQGISLRRLAAVFGVDYTNISLVVRRRTWTHI